MSSTITITEISTFDEAFGELGLKVGPRTGPNRRSKDDKEWHVLRQFLKDVIPANVFELPISIRKGIAPEPDFVIQHKGSDILIEITEATDEADQREMTELERSDEDAVLLGTFGGRFKDGASEPGYAWSSDITAAIERKLTKPIFLSDAPERHLIIYPNSNASFLLFDYDDECRAFGILRNAISSHGNLALFDKGDFVHVLGGKAIFVDVLGEQKCLKRSR